MALGAFALMMLSSQAALAAPGQTSGYKQLDKRYNDGLLNDGEHGFFLSIGTNSTGFHGDAGSEQMTSALVFQFLKADARLFGRKEVLFDGGLNGQATREGVRLQEAYTCATGRLRVMGSETLSRTGTCDDRAIDMLLQQGKEISKTFFKTSGDVTVAFIEVSVDLSARGTLRMDLTADTRNTNAAQGLAAVVASARGNLEVLGTLSVGVDYVARIEVRGRITLVDISFNPMAVAERRYHRNHGFNERAQYTLSSVAPLNIKGLDGRVSVAAFGNPTILFPFASLPVEVKLDESTVWDPPALISFNAFVDSRSLSEFYAADFGI